MGVTTRLLGTVRSRTRLIELDPEDDGGGGDGGGGDGGSGGTGGPAGNAPTIPFRLPAIPGTGTVTFRALQSTSHHDGTDPGAGVSSYPWFLDGAAQATNITATSSNILGVPTSYNIGTVSPLTVTRSSRIEWDLITGGLDGLETTSDDIGANGWAYTALRALSARISSMTTSTPVYPGDYGGLGIMLRDSSAAGSKFIAAYFTFSGYVYVKWRPTLDGAVSQSYIPWSGAGGALAILPIAAGSFEIYVDDGTGAPTLVKTLTSSDIALSATGLALLFGFALTAGQVSAHFSNISVTSSTLLTQAVATAVSKAFEVQATSAGWEIASAVGSQAAGTGLSINASATSPIAGDVIIAQVAGAAVSTWADNNGGTPLTKDLTDRQDSLAGSVSVFSRRLIAADPTTYAFTFGTSSRLTGQALRVRRPNAASIYNVAPSTSNSNILASAVSSAVSKAITTTVAGAIHVIGIDVETASGASAWTFGAIGATVYGYGSAVVPVVSGITAGMDLFMWVHARPSSAVTGTWNAVSGWTLVAVHDTDAASLGGALYWKKAAGGETGVTVTNTGSGVAFMGVMFRYSGGPASGLTYHAIARAYDNNLVVDIATPALTISSPNALVLTLAARSWSADTAGVASWPGGSTTRLAQGSAAGSFEMSLLVGSLVQTTAASIGAGSIDLVATDALRNSVMMVALLPGSTAPALTATPDGYTLLQNGGNPLCATAYKVIPLAGVVPDQTWGFTPAAHAITTSFALAPPDSAETLTSLKSWAQSGAPSGSGGGGGGGGSMKYNPGYAIWYVPEGNPSTGDSGYRPDQAYQNADLLAWIDTYGPNTSWTHFELIAWWRAFEGNTAGDYTDGFAFIDALLTKLDSYGKKLWMGVATTAFGGYPGTSLPFPSYLSSAGYVRAFDFGMGDYATIWRSGCMDYLIDLAEAYLARYDSDARVEGMFFAETAVAQAGTDGTFSNGALLTELSRLIPAARAAGPTTQLRMPANDLSGGATPHKNMRDLYASMAANKWIAGGPDVWPDDLTQADCVYQGCTQTSSAQVFEDYRDSMGWFTEFQSQSFRAASGADTGTPRFTLSQLFYATVSGYVPGNSQWGAGVAIRPFKPRYICAYANSYYGDSTNRLAAILAFMAANPNLVTTTRPSLQA